MNSDLLNLLPVRAREPVDGESTAGLRRQAGARRTNSLVSVARPALVTRFAGLVSETGEGRGQILPFAGAGQAPQNQDPISALR